MTRIRLTRALGALTLAALLAGGGRQAAAQEKREPEGTALPPYARVLLRPSILPPAARLEVVRNGLPNIMLTGYWPPTNEMLRQFSDDPVQNPGGWVGANWEDRGYNIYAFFPEFPGGLGKGEGDFEVDYQDTSNDWWPLVAQLEPIAIITFGRADDDYDWELEGGHQMYALNQWYPDYLAPPYPTPELPIAGETPGNQRWSTLPLQAIVNAVAASEANVNPYYTTIDDSNFLCDFIGYHATWYHDLHAGPSDPARNAAAGHVHVGSAMTLADAILAAEVTVRTLTAHLDGILLVRGDMNCDDVVDLDDITPFVTALIDTDAYAAAYPECYLRRADMNRDGLMNGADLQAFVNYFADCNGNSTLDGDDIANGISQDCNHNGSPDECDIAFGLSQDYDDNGVPDECEPDCNGNGAPDACDLPGGCAVGDCASAPSCGQSLNCDNNSVPDECEPDVTPPKPSPMTWESNPAPVSTSSVTMTASAATCEATPPVEYYFYTSPTGGGHSRNWDPARAYLDTGLTANTSYTYLTRARDSADPRNTGLWAPSRTTATHIETPTGLAAGTVTTASIQVIATGTFTNLTAGSSGLYFQCVETGASSGWIQTTSWTATDLQPGTDYTFTAKARNRNQVETGTVQGIFSTLP